MAYIFLCEKENVNEKKASISESILWVLILFSQIIHSLKRGILGREYIRYSLLFIPTTCLLIFFFATEKGIAVKLCTNKFLVCLGDLSSHAFLIHFVVIRYVQTIYEILGGGAKMDTGNRIFWPYSRFIMAGKGTGEKVQMVEMKN